ncbi:MAG: Ig-like domain-containing protein, partial [Bifidobacteriaceae bacterium]|nr:Ig-like domain-containing protein [Bifidobacteriaceae bacterium]
MTKHDAPTSARLIARRRPRTAAQLGRLMLWLRRPTALLAVGALASTGLVLGWAVQPAQAATVTLDATANYDCETLYAVGSNAATTVNLAAGDTSASLTRLYGRASGDTHSFNTMALGRSPVDHGGDGKLHAYHWAWDGASNGGTGQVSVLDIADGANQGTTFTVPNNPGATGWSGGEVNQLTGEIYFSGREDTYITVAGANQTTGTGGDFRMLRFDPVSKAAVQSGALIPNTPTDILNRNDSHVASDMAVDAEGNIYLVVGESTKRLIRVVPGETGNWRYSIVTTLQWSGTANNFNSTDVWGMGFLNGALYAVTYANNLFKIDPISGVVVRVQAGMSLPNNVGDLMDVATCQTAPVVRGVVYNDSNGDGQVSSTEGVAPGQTVELYDADENLLGTRTTDGAGGYSFILNRTDVAFYVRVVQPVIDSRHAVQSWASGSQSVNQVAARCLEGAGPVDQTVDGICRGNRADRIDPSRSLAGSVLNDALIVTKVQVNTSSEVAVASFGLTTAASHGDAPDSFGTLVNSGGPSHLAGPAVRQVWLGDLVGVQSNGEPSTAADSHTADDGVTVLLNGAYRPLADAILVAGQTYQFKVVTAGPAVSQGKLSAWFSRLNSAGTTETTFANPGVLTNVPTTSNDYDFSWQVPDGVQPAGGLQATYSRFRVAVTDLTGPVDTASSLPAAGSVAANTQPWVIFGEVEDYRAYQATTAVRLSVKTNQYAAGPFSFSFSNTIATAPSATSDSLTTTAGDTAVPSAIGHAVANPGSPVTISQTNAPSGWGIVSGSCTKDGSQVVAITSGTSIEIPANATAGGEIACQLTYGKRASGSQSELTASTGSRTANGSDQHTVTATVKSADGSPLAGETVSFTASAGANLSATTCQTDTSGQCSITVTATAAGSYEISATVPGAAGTAEALTNSPVTVVYSAGQPDPGHGSVQISTGPKTANGSDAYTVTVRLRDAS